MKAWTKAEDKFLGTMSNSAVARHLKRSQCSVEKRRERLGIPSILRIIDWKPSQVKLWGRLTDEEAARRLGCGVPSVARARVKRPTPPLHPKARRNPWTAAEDRLLGTLSDREVGQRVNRSAKTVHKRRRRL